MEIKGKGLMTTYFLLTDGTIPEVNQKPTKTSNGKEVSFESAKQTEKAPDSKMTQDVKSDDKVTKTSICSVM